MQGVLIRNGEVVTADECRVVDVLCEGEVITAIGADLPVPDRVEVIDADGCHVFPGFIDPHVHIHLPFMGTFAKDDYDSASRAALVGGTTTLIEMVCPGREDEPLKAFAEWNGKAQGVSACDYGFHMGVTRFDAEVEEQLRRIVTEHGVRSFKVFLAYKGAFGIDDAELYGVLKLAAELGVVVTAHCENAELVASLQAELVDAGMVGPEWHERSRPVAVEAEGCHHLVTFAELTGAEVYVVHTSCQAAVEVIQAAQERGVKAWIETVAPYLTLDRTYAEQGNFEGAKFVMSPPIRQHKEQDYLWKALAEGTIDTVGTDHAPFDFATQKHMGHPEAGKCVDAEFQPRSEGGNFTLIPNGIPSVEERVKLLYTHGVRTGKIDLQALVRVGSTTAAKIFGMYPRKGEIAVGSDADLVIWDPAHRGQISAKTHLMATDYSAWEGWPVEGRTKVVTLRGEVVVRDGKFVGTMGRGKRVERR